MRANNHRPPSLFPKTAFSRSQKTTEQSPEVQTILWTLHSETRSLSMKHRQDVILTKHDHSLTTTDFSWFFSCSRVLGSHDCSVTCSWDTITTLYSLIKNLTTFYFSIQPNHIPEGWLLKQTIGHLKTVNAGRKTFVWLLRARIFPLRGYMQLLAHHYLTKSYHGLTIIHLLLYITHPSISSSSPWFIKEAGWDE